MAKVAAQTQKEALPQGIGTGSLTFPFLSIFFSSFFFFFFAFVVANTGAKDLEPVVI